MDKRAIATEKQRQRYYRSANAIVLKALNSYTTQFGEDISKCETLAQMKAVADRPLRKDAIEKALKPIYSTVGKTFGEQTFKQLMPASKSMKFEPNIGGLVRPTDLGGNARSIIGLTPRTTPAALTTGLTDDYWIAWANKLLKGSLGQRITWITGTTEGVFKSVVDRIAYAGFESGKGVPQIAKEIMKDLNITERYRAVRIARTEVMSASNMSSHAGAQATGLDLDKEWISFIDDKTRDTHVALNGTKIGMNELFSNGLEMPGDVTGDKEEVINCRCTIGYGVKDSEYNW